MSLRPRRTPPRLSSSTKSARFRRRFSRKRIDGLSVIVLENYAFRVGDISIHHSGSASVGKGVSCVRISGRCWRGGQICCKPSSNLVRLVGITVSLLSAIKSALFGPHELGSGAPIVVLWTRTGWLVVV